MNSRKVTKERTANLLCGMADHLGQSFYMQDRLLVERTKSSYDDQTTWKQLAAWVRYELPLFARLTEDSGGYPHIWLVGCGKYVFTLVQPEKTLKLRNLNQLSPEMFHRVQQAKKLTDAVRPQVMQHVRNVLDAMSLDDVRAVGHGETFDRSTSSDTTTLEDAFRKRYAMRQVGEAVWLGDSIVIEIDNDIYVWESRDELPGLPG